MAESLAEKLKRLAAEKKAAKEAVAVVESTVTAAVASVANDQPVIEKASNVQPTAMVDGTGSSSNTSPVLDDNQPNPACGESCSGEKVGQSSGLDDSIDLSNSIGNSSSTLSLQPTPSNHPLAMQFAEMETALLTADPTFKTILRDVHRTLGKDPELVTQMTEEEISLVVRGLVVFANAEIVEPAKAKAVKAGQTALKKKAISADDL